MIRAFFTQFISTGRWKTAAWCGLLAGILSLAWYAYSEHVRRIDAEKSNTPLVLPLIQSLTSERQAMHHECDSLRLLLSQCQGRESQTYINYLTFKAHETARIDSARVRAGAQSGAQQQRTLAKRYPAKR